MKKALIGVVIAVVIGGGAYFTLNKTKQAVAEFGDKQLNSQIELYKKQPYVIKELQSHPMVKQAEIKVTESSQDTVKSLLTVALAEGTTIEVPLTSVITRGEAKYQDKSYGYGKIVTTPDIQQAKNLPDFIKADTIDNTTYIGLDGDLLNVSSVKSFTLPKNHLTFKGVTAVTDANISNLSTYHIDAKFKGFSSGNESNSFSLGPFKLTTQVDKDGSYTGTSTPLTINIKDRFGKAQVMQLGEGNYKGQRKTVEGLNNPIGNGSAQFKTFSLTVEGKTLQFNDFLVEGGLYEAGENLLDIKANASLQVDEQALKDSGLLAAAPVKITPKSLSFGYGLSKVNYDVVNTYFAVLGKVQPGESELPFTEAEQKAILQSLQKSDAGFSLHIAAKTAEGDADADMKVGLSEAGKAAAIDDLIGAFQQKTPEQAKSFFNGEANLSVSKQLVEITQTAIYLQMMKAKEENGNYVLKGELKDGIVSVNGQPMKMIQ